MKKILLFTFFFILTWGSLFSQQGLIDSLHTVIANPPNDTTLVNAWLALDNVIYLSDPTQDEELNKKVFDFSQKKLQTENNEKLQLFYKTKWMASINNLGIINMYRSDNNVARKYFEQAVKIAKELKNNQKIAAAYNNFGVLYYRQGDYKMSINYYMKALAMMEANKDMVAVAGALNNIGNIYKEIGDTNKALTTFQRSLGISKTVNANNWASVSYSSIAEIYAERGKSDSAEFLFKESLKLDQALGNKQGIGSDLANIAKLCLKKGKLKEAKENAEAALVLFKEVNDSRATGLALSILSSYYSKVCDISNAILTGEQGLDLLMSIGQIEEAEKSAETLYYIYKLKPDYKKALEMKELYGRLHDTLQNEKNTRAVIQQEYKYEYDKQAAVDSIKHAEENKVQLAEISKKDAELKVKRHIQIMLFVGLFMFLVFSLFLYNRFKVISAQNKIIEQQKKVLEEQNLIVEQQKNIVEEKQKEMVDSINYAKRIQQSQMPTDKYIDRNLKRLQKP